IEYSTTQGFTPGTGTAVASTNISGGSYSSNLTGLTPCTNYYYVAYGTNDGGTSYGSEDSFESGTIAAPVGTVPSTINQDSFTATWDAVGGASGYRLDVSTLPGFGTTGPVNLEEGFDGGRAGLPAGWSHSGLGTDYTTAGNFGASSPSLKFDTSTDQLLTGLLSGPATSLSFWYKGQGTAASASALLIEGYDGSGWSTLGNLTAIANNFVGTWSTTLNAGDNYVQFRFTYTKVLGNLAFDDLAIDYTALIPSFVPGYNDLAVAGISQSVTGLEPSTTYYYRVRVETGSCVSGNSNTIAVTTLACPGNSFIVAINTDANGDQTSWAVLDENDAYVAFGGPYPGQNNTLVTETICIGTSPVSACYQFHLYDSFGDGLSGVGNWQLRSVDGRVLLGDDFTNGYESPSSPPLNPSYGANHSFCLPPGPANIAPSECGIFNNMLGNKVYANKVTGAANYQFEFSDPDAGFMRRIARPYNYVHFWDMVTNPLVPGVKYFARVRTDRDGPMLQAHFGGGCEMGISLPLVVTCTQLISAPAYGHSCNETRTFNTNNSFIYAKPVQGATEYQFRIINTNEGYDQTFIRSTYILQLKWNNTVAPPLINGNTYNVEMNVKVNGLYSGFCASTCNITIDNGGNRSEASMVQTSGTATMWPNPVRDGQVNLNIDGLVDADQTITIDIKDVYGKQVFGQEFGNSGERFNTILNLSSEIASGVYMVSITVNGQSTVQRLSVIR
ncbi:MAG: T9SS type A sorting domain-containing protein, partial [Flavobacteriales bacterium]